jgi:hypothetical protein
MSSTWVEPGAVLLAAAVPAALMAVLLRLAGRTLPRDTSRRRVTCPVRDREARVDYVLRDDPGEIYVDVVACSLCAPGSEIACGKPCRSSGVAPFGTTRLAS